MARTYVLRNLTDDNGKPLYQAWCRAYNVSTGALVETQYTDTAGTCTFTTLPEDANVKILCIAGKSFVKWFYNIFSATQDLLYLSVTDAIIQNLSVSKLTAGSLLVAVTIGTDGVINASAGVKISPTGINIFGLGNALTTRATEAGTIQCYVGADGKIYAGGGNVWLSATELGVKATALACYDSTPTLCGWIYGSAGYLCITGNGTGIYMATGSGGVAASGNLVVAMELLPNSTVAAHDIGASGQYWDNIFCSYLYYKDGHGAFDDYDDIELIKGIKSKKVEGKSIIDIATIPKILRRHKDDLIEKKKVAYKARKEETRVALERELPEALPPRQKIIKNLLENIDKDYDKQFKEYIKTIDVDDEGYLRGYDGSLMSNLILGSLKQLIGTVQII